ncbi:MAG: outer membrane lipoprotein carrier protein LolA [Planctomycetes bacterium]|nr:outer membrane lipoprotein carrier protein LolA [Planctomycetota bacterium]
MGQSNKIIQSCILFTVFFIGPVLTTSQGALDNTREEVSTDEREEISGKFMERSREYHSITATVYQEKQLPLLDEEINITGIVTIKKPDLLRWDIAKPEKSITVVDGREMTVYYPDVNEAQVCNLSGNLAARSTMRFFSTVLSGSMSKMERTFTVDIFRKGSEISFKLIPKSRMVRRYISSIFIYYDEETGLPLGFETYTPKGGKTVTRLTNVRVNPEIEPGTFEIKLPEDVWIINSTENGEEEVWE